MIAAAHALTADQWILIIGIAAPIVAGFLGRQIAGLRKQVNSAFHDLHHHDRILNGEEGVGPGIVKRVEQLESKRS